MQGLQGADGSITTVSAMPHAQIRIFVAACPLCCDADGAVHDPQLRRATNSIVAACSAAPPLTSPPAPPYLLSPVSLSTLLPLLLLYAAPFAIALCSPLSTLSIFIAAPYLPPSPAPPSCTCTLLSLSQDPPSPAAPLPSSAVLTLNTL